MRCCYSFRKKWHYILSLRRRHAALGRTLRVMEDVHDGMTGQLRMREVIKSFSSKGMQGR